VERSLILVSPASPENAINVCWFNDLVLSSEALRMVAPLMAALEAAMMVKSLPVNPSKTSLLKRMLVGTDGSELEITYMLMVFELYGEASKNGELYNQLRRKVLLADTYLELQRV
jgi:hypothetical protein